MVRRYKVINVGQQAVVCMLRAKENGGVREAFGWWLGFGSSKYVSQFEEKLV